MFMEYYVYDLWEGGKGMYVPNFDVYYYRKHKNSGLVFLWKSNEVSLIMK